MSINIFRREFYRIFRPTLLWTFFISLFIFVDMIFFQQMIESGMFDQLLGIMENPFIGDMIKSFGVNPVHLSDALGFYSLRNTLVTMLMASIYAVITSSSLIAMEEYDKTSEFLLTRPVTRLEIMNSKFAAFQINLFFLNLVSCIVGYFSLELFKMSEYNLYAYIVLCIYSYLLTLIFGSIGLCFSLLMKRGRVFMGAIIGIVLGTYFFDILSRVSESSKFIGYISPFYYANKKVMEPGYDLELWNLVFFLAGTLILTIASYRIFQKKDIMV